jgi:uncharacterized repeat protein (TIGR04052 family)
MNRSYTGVLTLAAILLVTAACADSTEPQGPRPVSIRFSAQLAGRPFACGQSYTGIGTSQSTVSPKDLRIYVHNVRLVSNTGVEVPVTLDADGVWQNGQVALLYFENGTGDCSNGTAATRDVVTGMAPAGNYSAVRFAVGVPFELNHTDVTQAASPLNLSSMFWAWNIGRIFFKLDLKTTGQPGGWSFHVGSTGCAPSGNASAPPTTCSNGNRTDVALSTFSPSANAVMIDLSTLLSGANVDDNIGCHSFPGTPACAQPFARIGLPYGGTAAGAQSVFRVGS